MADNSAFAKALHNFTMDASCGDAIRHLTDRGYTFDKIKASLTFPAKDDYIAKVMWERLLETGKVVLGEVDLGDGVSGPFSKAGAENGPLTPSPRSTPPARSTASVSEIVEIRDEYGRKSFLKVQKESPEEVHSPEDYVQYEDLLVLTNALEQVSSLSGRIPLKDRSTGSHRDM